MANVFSVDDSGWKDLRGLPGPAALIRALTDDAYTKAYSCELLRLSPAIIPFLTSSPAAISCIF